MDNLELKKCIVDTVIESIQEKIDVENKLIAQARECAADDPTCCAGNKYETTRAMMHIDIEQYSLRVVELQSELKGIASIDISIKDRVDIGAVVKTNIGNFFIAISGDDIEIEDEEYTPISIASPIGALLKGKKKDNTATFRGKKIKIEDLF